MNNSETKDGHIKSNKSIGVIHRNIRKLKKNKSTKKYSACSQYTLPETLTKSANDKMVYPVSEVLSESMGLIEKPTIIPLLQTLLNESSNEPKEREDPSLCNYILLKEKTKEQIKEFKLFEESNVPMFSQNMTNINLNEPGYDNDDETDNEQIRNGSKIIHDAISDALRNYKKNKKEVTNIVKYHHSDDLE